MSNAQYTGGPQPQHWGAQGAQIQKGFGPNDENFGAGRPSATPSASGRDLLSMLQGMAFSERGLAGLAKGKK